MFKFFESVAGIFKTAVDYLVGLFELLLNLMKLVLKAQAFLIQVVGRLPPFLVVFFIVFVSLAILFQILNKGS